MYASGAGLEVANATFPGLFGVGKADPHFPERMRIMQQVVAAELRPLAELREPPIRAALAEVYARRFEASQLDAAAAFYATPAGRAIAAETYLMTLNPAIVRLLTPPFAETIRIMASVQKKVEAATAHLPPPPKPGKDAEPDKKPSS